MAHHLCSYVLVPLWSVALVAQQAAQVSTKVPQGPAAVTSDGPAQQPSTGILQDGTPVKLRLLNNLDSRSAKQGDEILFEVVNHLVVGGVIVLRRGSLATGVVTQAEGSKTLGRPGKLSFTINDIKLGDGTRMPVRAFHQTSGENLAKDMVVPMMVSPIVAAPFFLLIHGTNTILPRGTEINAFGNGDLRLDLASFGVTP